jgi:hypothetical protein
MSLDIQLLGNFMYYFFTKSIGTHTEKKVVT